MATVSSAQSNQPLACSSLYFCQFEKGKVFRALFFAKKNSVILCLFVFIVSCLASQR